MAEPLLSKPFLLCFAANLLQATSFTLFLHFPGFLAELGAGTTVIGAIAALTALSSITVSPLVGRTLDLTGRRGVILAGSVLNVVLLSAFMTIDTLGPMVIALRMMHGAAEMALHVAFFTCALDVVPFARRAQGVAVFGTSALAAVGLGALIGDWAFSLGGYRGIFVTSLALSLVAGAASLAIAETRTSVNEKTPPSGWSRVIAAPDLRRVWLLTTAFFFSMTGVFVYMKTWVLETGIGSVGLYFGIYSGTAICVRLLLGWIPDRLGAARMAAPTLLLYAAGFLVLAVTGSLSLFIAAAVLGGIGHAYGYPVLLTLVTDRAGAAARGSGVAVYGAIDDGAALIAAPVLGYVIDLAGYPVMYLLAAMLILAAVTACRVS